MSITPTKPTSKLLSAARGSNINNEVFWTIEPYKIDRLKANLKTHILDSFRKEVLIQNEFFAYHKLVQWMHKKKIKKFDFQTKSTKYVFEALEDGINIYTSSVYFPKDVSKRFASFSYYLPKKGSYHATKV